MTKSATTLDDVVKSLNIKKPVGQFVCKYCNKGFARESSLAVHMCEKKKRHQDRDEPGIRLAFRTFTRFYETTQSATKVRTFDDFVDSPYYTAFAKFGRYMVAVNAINPPAFIEWILKSQKKIDRWASDRVYEEYLAYYIVHENVGDALERGITHAMRWAEANNSQASDYFRYASVNSVCQSIITGRISPWILYSSTQGQEFLNSKLNPEQVKLIWPIINPDVWAPRISRNREDWEFAKQMLAGVGW